MGNAVRVAADGYGSGKADEVQVAVELGQGGFGGGAKPEDAGQRGEREQNQQSAAAPEKNAGPAAIAARLEWRRRRLQRACWKGVGHRAESGYRRRWLQTFIAPRSMRKQARRF